MPNSILSQSLIPEPKLRYHVKISGTIHTLGDTKDQSLSPVTLKQTFLCDVKP